MKPTEQQIIAAIAIAITLMLTLGPLLDFGVSFTPSNTQMKIEPRRGDLDVKPASKCTNPLMTDFSLTPKNNPYTRAPQSNEAGLFNPPAPPLDLPQLPALPIPDKDK